MANDTLRAESVSVTPDAIDEVINASFDLKSVAAVIDLAVRDIDDGSSGCNALGVVQIVMDRVIDRLEAVELVLRKMGREARNG